MWLWGGIRGVGYGEGVRVWDMEERLWGAVMGRG